MTAHILAGIPGYKLTLDIDAVADVCLVGIPGCDKVIAQLPTDTVDAVLTEGGMLVYKDSRDEIRALTIPHYKQIYQASVAASAKENAVWKSAVTGKALPFSQAMGRHTGGMVSAEDGVNIASKDAYEKSVSDLVQKYVAPLAKNVQRLIALNTELASRVKELEMHLACQSGNTMRTDPIAPPENSPIREVSWGDQGGLPNFLHPQDNPFCGKGRG